MRSVRPAGLSLLFLSFLLVQPLASQPASHGLRLGASGGLSLPIGDSSTYYAAGYFSELSGYYELTESLGLGLAAGYSGLPLVAGPRIDLGQAEAGLAYARPLGALFVAQGRIGAGGFFGILSGSEGFTNASVTSAAGASASANLSLAWRGIKNMEIRLGGAYRNLFGLWNGLELGISGSYRLEPKVAATTGPRIVPLGSGGLAIDDLKFGNVFPVFFKYYNDHAIGSATLTNNQKKPITDVSLTFYMKQYMDSPKVCATIPKLEPGEKAEVQLLALFTDKMLEITEGTIVSADIAMNFSVGGEPVQASGSEAVRVLDRNSMSWFDDRCAAAYITAKDPGILSFAKNVTGSIRGEMNSSVNKNFQIALALHQALDLYGMNYVIDPKSSYSSTSANKEVVDFLQFPRQTLEYRAGDCDDLSILFTALLESVGIETALLTVPGHIYMAFSLELSAEEARKAFTKADELIMRDERAWLPVEITDRKGGFLAAWQLGAKEWREAAPRGQAGFLPVHEAWTVFEPVGLPGATADIAPPPTEAMLARYRSETATFIEREIFPLVSKAQAEIARSQGAPKAVNSLGVLYARFGQYDKAEQEFAKNLVSAEYLPSLLNLGNIANLKKNRDKAMSYFERAYKAEPGSAQAVLAFARSNHEAENYGLVKKLYVELSALNPSLATQFAYLDLRGEEATRAADISATKDQVLWSE